MTELLAPVHPGEVLYHEFMIPLKLSCHTLAHAIKVTPTRIAEIVQGKRGITADTALRLSRYFGTTPNVWMILQNLFEVETTQHKLTTTLTTIKPRWINGGYYE